ncbi:3-oxoacyl-ACP reductase [Planoprotostelium fungivorum]|uniref:3-oxoacyl-ACP reductase n=1 Tax=Planoprotostelium fungivorum TaxID=1890364 RepID=A0A2P6NA37_9EUKA|nr:3-oxoacyl-ACP reductase [Planoprotostelium fungivorum]
MFAPSLLRQASSFRKVNSLRPVISFRGFASQVKKDGRLAGKVALITGASSGIGKETSLLFAREGASLVLVDVDDKRGNEVTQAIKDMGAPAIYVHADVSKMKDSENMVAVAEKEYGKLNIVFNNAGISHADDDDAVKTSEEVFDLTMNINVKGVFAGCKYAVPALKRAGGGSIINTASFVAILGAATPQIAYTASKGAVLSMTRELAVIHAREGIRVNALCPGPLRTELLMKYLNTDEKKNRRLVHVPLGRFGEAAEIANGVLFLASDESSFVTGSTFLVDGGMSLSYLCFSSLEGITAAYVTPL